MSRKRHRRFLGFAPLVAAMILFCALPALSCSRAVYFGLEGQTTTGRTMDWKEDVGTNLWVFPRGMERDGGMGEKGFRWTSRYGTVIASFYEAATVDGMNEKGLVANLLFLSESKYPDAEGDNRPLMALSAWAQYVLDSFATVGEAVAEIRREAFRPVLVVTPNGVDGTGHLSISDPSGDSAIFEYIDGSLVIHHGRSHQIMTNSPTYEKQLALDEYWKEIGGTVMLPGTNRAADHFARASFYINAARQSADPREAVATVFSVMRNVSVPRGITTADRPNISSTLWVTVADQKNRVYYFQDTASPSLVWLNLEDIDFSPSSAVRKLALSDQADLGGDQTANLTPAEPFAFLAPRE